MRCEYTFLKSLREDLVLPNGLFLCSLLSQTQSQVPLLPNCEAKGSLGTSAQMFSRLGARAEVQQTGALLSGSK